jgi:hypothetical protein
MLLMTNFSNKSWCKMRLLIKLMHQCQLLCIQRWKHNVFIKISVQEIISNTQSSRKPTSPMPGKFENGHVKVAQAEALWACLIMCREKFLFRHVEFGHVLCNSYREYWTLEFDFQVYSSFHSTFPLCIILTLPLDLWGTNFHQYSTNSFSWYYIR